MSEILESVIIKDLIENLNLWAERYSGKPISLTLFRAAAILGELERRRDEAMAKYDILAVENMLEVNKLCNERDEARAVLREIANASHFDNIGNWARNKAKKALEDAK